MVKIPESLLFQVIDLLELWDASGCGFCISQNKEEALCALREKRDSIERRKAYSKLVATKNDSDRHDARIDYLKLRNAAISPH